MSWSGGTDGAVAGWRSRAVAVLVGAGLVCPLTACSQPEPDEHQVVEVVSALPGVVGVDASFTGRTLGSSGDQSIEVRVAARPDPGVVEALVRTLPRALRDVDDADGYDEFAITTAPREGGGRTARAASVLTFGREAVPAGLVTRWAESAASAPGDGVRVRVCPAPRRASASLSTADPVSTSLEWALGTDLVDLDWSIVDHQTTSTPYVRFAPDRPLEASMVEDWSAIEAALAGAADGGAEGDTGGEGAAGAASRTRVVVVEDEEGIRRVRVAVSFPQVPGPLPEVAHGPAVWPVVDAVHASMPEGHQFDLELGRAERRAQSGSSGDGDLVDGGTGSADWEAAYRQRYPDAVVSATPT